VDFLDAGLKRIEDLGLFEVTPHIPEEIRLRATEKAGLQVKPATKKEFREISRKHEAIDGASESAAGCIILTDRMRATLQPLTDLETLKIVPGQGDEIEELSDHRDTSWSWEIKGYQAGSPQLYLDLEYEISQEEQKFRGTPGSPVYKKQIKVTSSPAPEPPSAPEPPWWQRIFERISELFGA
jgi:hypothetical protein